MSDKARRESQYHSLKAQALTLCTSRDLTTWEIVDKARSQRIGDYSFWTVAEIYDLLRKLAHDGFVTRTQSGYRNYNYWRLTYKGAKRKQLIVERKELEAADANA